MAGYANTATISLCSAQGTITNNGGTHVGGLVGSAGSSTTRTSITRCYADATITYTPAGSNNSYTGGLVGQNSNNSPIVACGANTNITVTDNNTNCYAGGLVGENNNSNIYFCYATGTVSVNGSITNRYAGGLVGRNNNNSSTAIYNSYATATATGSTNYTGTLIGDNAGNITNCHAPKTPTVGTGNPTGIATNGDNVVPQDIVTREANIPGIITIHLDPNTGYHDALYPIVATFNANNVWTDADYPTINYNYNGRR